jgi:hypothetical protein
MGFGKPISTKKTKRFFHEGGGAFLYIRVGIGALWASAKGEKSKENVIYSFDGV